MIIFGSGDMTKLGRQAVKLIVKRTLSGKDVHDKPFKAYSKLHFKMPAAAMTKRTREAMDKAGVLTYFSAKVGDSRIRWVVVQGGYYTYKKFHTAKSNGSSPDTVNLTLGGSMLMSINVLSVTQNMITIGFTRAEEAQKALWNIQRGRNFFGLSPEDIKQLDFTDITISSK